MRSWKFALLAGVGTLAVSVAPAVAAPADDSPPPVDEIDQYPLAEGSYTNSGSGYFSWIYFRTPDGRSCGIAPNGGPVGCDAVPSDAPAGTNQTVATAWSPAAYRYSDTATFTRDFPVLPAGRRVQTIGAACAVDNQGAVHCQTEGNHGFILSVDHGTLW